MTEERFMVGKKNPSKFCQHTKCQCTIIAIIMSNKMLLKT